VSSCCECGDESSGSCATELVMSYSAKTSALVTIFRELLQYLRLKSAIA
jgi:hypothetical protein